MVITESAETNIRKEQHSQSKAEKQKERETLASLKDVVITDTAETDIRKQQASQPRRSGEGDPDWILCFIISSFE